jgi:predicted small secreted protein
MKTKIVAFSSGLFAIAVTGCNTTRGIGQDIEAAGDKIEDVADDAEDRLSE